MNELNQLSEVDQLAEWGWTKRPSKVRRPDGAWRYHQRWEDGSPFGWFEFPHDLPIRMVFETIRDASIPRTVLEMAIHDPYDPTA